MYAMHVLQNNFLEFITEREEKPVTQYTCVQYSCQVHSGLSFTDLIISHFMVV